MSATIGSSDVAAILGLSPWRGPWDVWPGLVGLVERYSKTDTPAQRRGRIVERLALELYGERMGVEWAPGPGLSDAGEVEVGEGWAHSRVDAWEFNRDTVHAVAVLEVKSLWFFDDDWGEDGSSKVPLHYLVQGYWHHYVTGLPVRLLAYATRSDELRVYDIEIDPVLLDSIVTRVRAWWERHVRDGHPPDIDGTEACVRNQQFVYSVSPDKPEREATAEEWQLVSKIRDLTETIARYEATRNEVKAELQRSIGADYKLTHQGQTLAIYYPTKTGRTLRTYPEAL